MSLFDATTRDVDNGWICEHQAVAVLENVLDTGSQAARRAGEREARGGLVIGTFEVQRHQEPAAVLLDHLPRHRGDPDRPGLDPCDSNEEEGVVKKYSQGRLAT